MIVIREFGFISCAMMACIEILVDHNIACRQPILDAVENLTNEEFIKDMGVGIGSIRDILVHLVNTEDYWISLLKGKDTKKINPENFNDIDTIRKIWAERETSTKDFLEYQNDRTLQVVRNVTWDGVTVHFTVAKALIHMATHETHHRGLIIGIIRQLRYEPPNVNML